MAKLVFETIAMFLVIMLTSKQLKQDKEIVKSQYDLFFEAEKN